jgi:uncharacterized protein (DUF2062 family)
LKTALTDFWRRRIFTPVLDLLRQGVTPEKIALSIALGAALGVFPVLGSTTLLCAAAALAFRLNLPAIQLVNYLIYPLQLALLVPFMKAGAWLFGADGTSPTVSAILEMARHGVWHAISSLWTVTVQAIFAWSLAAPLPALAAYVVLTAVLKKAGAGVMNRPDAETLKES